MEKEMNMDISHHGGIGRRLRVDYG